MIHKKTRTVVFVPGAQCIKALYLFGSYVARSELWTEVIGDNWDDGKGLLASRQGWCQQEFEEVGSLMTIGAMIEVKL